MDKDLFGDRMKTYEAVFTSQVIPSDSWYCVRIDGKGFSKFTKGFKKPFDYELSSAFIETTKAIFKETHANVGYTQSDEITLIYSPAQQHIFGGKVSKINSVFASMASAYFNREITRTPKPAIFDCRAWAVPNAVEASNALLWRVQDARKNSISSLFRWAAGHKKMQNLNSVQMRKLLLEEYNVDWDNLPERFKHGTYIKNVAEWKKVTDEMKQYHDGEFVERSVAHAINLGYFGNMTIEERIAFVSEKVLGSEKSGV